MKYWQLRQRQSLSLEDKIQLSLTRIRAWYEYWDGNVYISFSGGKDSTVLLHLVRSLYPNVTAVFSDTGLEFPEIRQFVKTIDNVIWIKPKHSFKDIIEKYGYPIISKENAAKLFEIRNTKSTKLFNIRLYGNEKNQGKLPKKWRFLIDAPFKISSQCCYHLKKSPLAKYEKQSSNKPFIGTMTEDSSLRKTAYLIIGCNAFESKKPKSMPIAFWKEEDIWNYIKLNNLPFSSIYNMGYKNTGCVFCAFGLHLQKEPNKFQLLKKTHPSLWNYCMYKLNFKEILDYCKFKYE